MKFGLKATTIAAIQQCMEHTPKLEEAVIYGSRAKGNYRPGSDIDLVLKGEDLTLSDVAKLEDEIDDLLLPYKFDMAIFHQINNPDLLNHIARVGQIFYKKNQHR